MIDRYVEWTPGEIAPLRPLCTATYPPSSIVIHHTGGGTAETPQGIHTYHKQIGYGGCGYHYLIDREGLVWRGRPVWARGAHCRNNNAGRIGIALMGNYDATPPPADMLRALLRLIDDIQHVYGRLDILKHKDVPGSNTDCPGAACVAALDATGIMWGKA
jgi:N-acetylmuramoyl-L-alanine amidase